MTRTHCAKSARLLLFFAELDLARTRITVVPSRLPAARPQLAIGASVGTSAANRPVTLRAIAITGGTVGASRSVGAARSVGPSGAGRSSCVWTSVLTWRIVSSSGSLWTSIR
ncbi:hypothetical protein ITJ38_05370 [Agreia pratensis]|nr:hypothetical protein [Agreia pratensis]